MTTPESWLAVYLLNALWQVPLIFAVAWLSAQLLRANGPALQHRVWVTALALQVLLPACSLPSAGIFRNVWHSILLVLRTTPTGQRSRVTVITGDGYSYGSLGIKPTLLTVALMLYLAVIAYFACRLCWRLWRSYALLREANEVAVLDLKERSLLHAARFGVADAAMASSSAVCGPVTLGVLRRVLLIPENFGSTLALEDIDAAFAHEYAHMQRRDFAKNLLYELLSLPLAWYPLVRLTLRQIAGTREMLCDAMAAQAVDGPDLYAKSLLRLAAVCIPPPPASTLHAIGIFDAHNFERRIMELTMKRIGLRKTHRLALVALCIALGLGTCASALALRVKVSVSAMKRQETAGPARISGGVMAGQILSKVDPVYPEAARNAGVTGSVVLHAIIGHDGTIRQLAVISGPPMLQPAAMDAVRQWVYKPYLLNGNPTEVDTTITVNFTLAP